MLLYMTSKSVFYYCFHWETHSIRNNTLCVWTHHWRTFIFALAWWQFYPQSFIEISTAHRDLISTGLSAGCQEHVITHTHRNLFRSRYLAIRAMSHVITAEPDCLHECMSLPTDVNFHQENVKPCHSLWFVSHQGQFATVEITCGSSISFWSGCCVSACRVDFCWKSSF